MNQQTFSKRNKRIRGKVIRILSDYPEARSNYQVLLGRYWLQELDKTEGAGITLDDLRKVTKAESITREYRIVKKLHPYLKPPQGIEDKKKELEENYRIEYSRN